MMLVLIIGILFIGATSGLRKCNDCTDIPDCKEAYNIVVTTDDTQAAYDMLAPAKCGHLKVCCSDFRNGARSALITEGTSEAAVDNEINNEDEIENHPNAYLLPDECGEVPDGRIFGGETAAMNEFPWMALISHKINRRKQFNCGGTVINERYVLTAAHCIKGKIIVGVRVGEYKISSKTDCTGVGSSEVCQEYRQNVGVSKKIVHPGYVRSPMVLNDIGLLRVKKPLVIDVPNAGAACLPVLRSLRDMDLAGERGIVAGWGTTENGEKSDVLLKVAVPIYEKNSCRNYYEGNRRKKSSSDRFASAFCAGELYHDSCGGDSGGPLMIRAPYKYGYFKLIQFGIVSYGPSQCGSGNPGVYTDVKEFMKWILDTIEP